MGHLGKGVALNEACRSWLWDFFANLRRASGTCAVALLLQGLVSTAVVAQPADAEKSRLAIVLKSEQAVKDLAFAIIALIPDAPQPNRPPPHLEMPPGRAAEAIKKIDDQGQDGRYHRNPQPRMLDLAIALKVWPGAEAADDIRVLPDPEFYKKFGPRVEKQPETAFPDIVVTRYPFRMRLLVSSALQPPRAALYREKGTTLLEEDRETLCNPSWTLMGRSSCRVEIRDRAFEDESFVERLQVGFRVETRAALPAVIAEGLARRVKAAIELSRGSTKLRDGDVVTILIPERISGASPQQGQTQQALQQPASLDVEATELHDVWKRARGSLSDLQLPNAPTQWPTINLYDSAASDQHAILYKDWLARLIQAPYGPAGPGCSLAHTDAAVSVLFPEFVKSRLLPESSIPVVPDYFRGAIRGRWKLYDPPAESTDSFDKNGQPVIGVAVFTDRWRQDVAKRLATSLSDPLSSRILVVSTPAKNVVPQGYGTSFQRNPFYNQDIDASSVVESCRNLPFPACLGLMPRVLVVAPVEHLVKYTIGSSVVGIAAPGSNVPVLHNCHPNDDPPLQWARSRATGSSFTAPLVAAVVAKIVGSSSAARPAATDPLVAMLRVLATADPLAVADGEQHGDVAYGKLNTSRALTGATAAAEGPGYRATVYGRNKDKTVKEPEQLIVAPYPWTFDHENMQSMPGSNVTRARQLGLAHRPRGVFRAEKDGVSRPNNDFRNVLRIVKRKEKDESGRMLFDVFYLAGVEKTKATRRVKVLSEVPLGSVGFDPGREGHCAENNATTAFPACLYYWKVGDAKGFQPLDFADVDEIVLSPNHFQAPSVAGFDSVDFILAENATAGRPLDSPWRQAFCETRINTAVLKAIVRAQHPDEGANGINAKMSQLRQAHGVYCPG